MRLNKILAAVFATILSAAPLGAAPLVNPSSIERLNYSWKLTGALAWIARVAIPTSGVGTLETREEETVHSRLTMTTPQQRGMAFYESSMSADGTRTFTSADGYSWRDRSEEKRVVFDYEKGVARVEERSSHEGVENKVRQLQESTPQDVLTSIYYLRQNAHSITSPRRTVVYSNGKPYSFIFAPQPVTTMRRGSETVRVRHFDITPIDGKKKGAIRVWLTDDEQSVPLRIEIDQQYATLKLDLKN
jgi:hypothetical protein